MPIHPWLGVEHVQPQEQGAAGTAGWVMGMEQVQVMGFLLLVVDSGSGSAASVNQASTLQWSGESKGRRAVYRVWLAREGGGAAECLSPFHRHRPAEAGGVDPIHL